MKPFVCQLARALRAGVLGSLVAPVAGRTMAQDTRPVEAGPRAAQAALRLHLLSLTCDPDPGPALVVRAKVGAVGMAGQPIRLEVGLRTADGVPLGAAPGAPAEYGDAKSLRVVAVDQIRFAGAEWQPHVVIPYQAIALPGGAGRRVVVTARALVGGLCSVAELWTTLPPDPSLPAPRALRLLQFGHFHGQPDPQTAPGPDPAAVGGVRTVAVRFGCVVCGTVEANGLNGEAVQVALALRRPDGEAVRAARNAPAATVDASGAFVARATDHIRFDAARWDSLCAFVPYAALDLAPGQEHRLILTYRVGAGGLQASAEEEFVLRTAGETPPVTPVTPATPPPATPPPATGPLALPPNFLDLVPGRSTRQDVHDRLGRPGQPGTLLPAALSLRLTRLELCYDAEGVVQTARIETARKLTPDVAALLFSLGDRPTTVAGDAFAPADRTGETISYGADGVHLRVAGGVVTVLWLTLPGAKAGAVPGERPEVFVAPPAGPR